VSDSCKTCGAKDPKTICQKCGNDFYEDPKDRELEALRAEVAELRKRVRK
jgi:hypothetical protein